MDWNNGYSNYGNNFQGYNAPQQQQYYGNQQQTSYATVNPVNFQNNQNNSQSSQPSYIRGRMVDGETEIMPAEVPNDGNYAIFIQKNRKAIYAKTWSPSGLIETNVYVPEDERNAQLQNLLNTIMQRLDNIESALQQPKTGSKSTTKKEEVTNNA